eukprot:CAMPEP_0172151170 /NCGR_PEP_ID=MMETSP1050-20130122/70_1 /TAXON_ID=233186 /ORGANISM="Cryptomonas curvata, Strain CCAP979/52" /LENGTH=129 /DNA_ID=CAMNT_0012819225 /DNA_START=259 /DNA_END=645 /DNA_ORIENTATION=-
MTCGRHKVEAKILDVYAWAKVRPEYWSKFFKHFRREHKSSYTFVEFFALHKAVSSGEFYSSDEPDAYGEPEKWVRTEDGRLTPRAPKYEPVLLSPRTRFPPSAFKECLGQLLHHCGLDDPRLLYYRLCQ